MTDDLKPLFACVARHDRTVQLVTNVGAYLLILACGADITLTRWLLDSGRGYEANTVMAWFVTSWFAPLVKIGLPAWTGWRVQHCQRVRDSALLAGGLCVVLGVYVAVVAHNALLVVTR